MQISPKKIYKEKKEKERIRVGCRKISPSWFRLIVAIQISAGQSGACSFDQSGMGEVPKTQSSLG